MQKRSTGGTASKPAAGGAGNKSGKRTPELEEFLGSADFTGAVTLLEFQRRSGEGDEKTLEWLAYSAFHNGDYSKAIEAYDELLESGSKAADERRGADAPASGGPVPPGMLRLFKACAQYQLGQYAEAEASAQAGTDCPLRNRLMMHISHKLGKDSLLMAYHGKLSPERKEDQLSLAALRYLRTHFQEATDIYKRVLLENRDDLAINLFIALCYYKLDYYDVSLEVLGVYLQSKGMSPTAINLKACNHYRLYNGKAAEAELKALADSGYNIEGNDIMRHNLVVFRAGENALRVLPKLMDTVPEARLNLVIYHLRQGAVTEAYDLLKDVTPSIPSEYILKAVVNAAVAQKSGSREHLKTAQQYFNMVGASPSECDTIPGRQCMASCFFLMKQFEEVNVYLSSIKDYMFNEDEFNWNYGISAAAVGNYKEAEERLLLVQSPGLVSEYVYVSWLCRCFIMNGRPRQAWEQYLRMDTSPDSLSLLNLIANDCYRTGAFYFAAKAFDVLERLDPDPEYWEGKRGAVIGVLQAVIAGTETKESLREVLVILRNTNNPQVEYISRAMSRWL